jgi:hypothetical protein
VEDLEQASEVFVVVENYMEQHAAIWRHEHTVNPFVILYSLASFVVLTMSVAQRNKFKKDETETTKIRMCRK